MNSFDVLIVGASAAGLSTAEALRRLEFKGRIAILGAEQHAPYDRPPLSKQVLAGDWEPNRAQLRTPSHIASLDIDTHYGESAVNLDVTRRTVLTSAGRRLQAEHIVIATGATPRCLPNSEAVAGVHVLRTLDDAIALRADLRAGGHLVIVGDGALGCEVASTAARLGVDTTLIGQQDAPMAAQIGEPAATQLAALHTRSGVRVLSGTGVSGLTERHGRVSGVALDTGESLTANIVLVAIGATPTTDWLSDSGLDLRNGVGCDSTCQAAPGIFAVGDVARFLYGDTGQSIRLENRTNATEQATSVAHAITGRPKPYQPIPYFWTDQFDTKIQVYGSISANANVDIVEGSVDEQRFVARYERDGVATAIVGWNMPKQTRLRRPELQPNPTQGASTE